MKNISNQEIKGTCDWMPEEMATRNYIFNTWRQVCKSFGFIEYLTPLLENADIYRAKSGGDLGQKELMVFVDQGGRELAIRPEMTPSVVRMVSKTYNTVSKPLKLFSIANFIRNEKPQRGRNREFWQLNCDIFSESGELADLEILQLAIDLVLAFNPPKNSFVLKINHRGLINSLFDIIKIKDDQKTPTMRLMDKYNKMSGDELIKSMEEIGLKNEQIDKILKFIKASDLDDLVDKIKELKTCFGFIFLKNIISQLNSLGYKDYVEFDSAVIRGFDYYDGLVFELFDKHPDNNRAMFGGGRYNSLSNLFGVKDFPAIGFAPGDETFKLFLESWNILPSINLKQDYYYLPLLSEDLKNDVFLLAKKLRRDNYRVELGLSITKISRALEYADKNKITQVIILGEDEKKKGVYKIKDMLSGEEKIINL
ncbi:MAG TPA: histidine--tRNA ligase [bacterium]|nr:histidine--tRNA ligase [bacterium]